MMRMEKQRPKFATKLTSPAFSVVHVFLVLLVGYFLGQHSPAKYHHRPENDATLSSGSFQELESVPLRSTSHVDDQGRPITKQQLIDPFVLPRLAGISVATLLPGQRVSLHQHKSMHEFFFILDGRGTFRVEKAGHAPQVVGVSQGSFVHCAPHEKHEIIGPTDSTDQSLKIFVVGITLD